MTPDLGTAGARLWASVTDTYDLAVHEELILLEACRVADRLDDLAAAAAGSDLTVVNHRGDQVANPLLVEARQQGIVLTRLLASLRLPDDDAEDGTTGARPQRRGPRGAYQPRLVSGGAR